MTDREVMQEALEALEGVYLSLQLPDLLKVVGPITALRTALEQPEQEPVAWMHKETGLLRREISRAKGADWDTNYWEPLYATAQRPWQGLTDEDMKDPQTHIFDFIYGARWAEAKLKERNI